MRNNGRTRTRGLMLPAHPQRKEDELLSSWIVRTAKANAIKLHTFSQQALEGEEIWNRDIDKSASPRLVRMLAGVCGKPEAEVWGATLRGRYEGRLYAPHNATGNTRWLMPVGVYHRTRTRHGLLYCPVCLRDDDDPYFRTRWRLGITTVCHEHEAQLLNGCPDCSEPVAFHRADFEDRSRRSTKPITYCSGCGGDLRAAEAAPVERRLLLGFQKELFAYLRRGYVDLPEYGRVRSHLWFDVVYQLAKVVGITRRGEKLRAKLEALTGEEERPTEGLSKGGGGIEGADLAWRRHVLYLVAWMLLDWPNRLLEVAKGGVLTRSIALISMRKAEDRPWWYEDFCTRHLKTPKYSPTETEIRSAYRYLEREGKPRGVKPLSRLLGLKESKKVRQMLNAEGGQL